MNWSNLQTRTNAAALAVFGELVTIGAATGIRAAFEDPYALARVGDAGMASNSPALSLQTSSVPATPVGQLAVVRGVSYVVALHEPDGYGMSRLVLEKP